MTTTGRTYRINVVSEMTGVPAATLRAWERRYGFPKPQRTDSRYRVYTEEDVAMVRRMKDLLQSGMAPSDSASLLISETSSPQPTVATGFEANPHEASVQRIVAAARSMSSDAIEKEVRVALTLGDAVSVIESVLGPSLSEIQRLRVAGELTIAHEQIAAEVLTLAARQLLRLMPTEQARRSALVVCVGTCERALDLYAVAFRCVEQGVRPELLSAPLPAEALGAVVQERAPDVVAVWIGGGLPKDQAAGELAKTLLAAAGSRPLVLGGEGIEAVASAFASSPAKLVSAGGAELATTLRAALLTLR